MNTDMPIITLSNGLKVGNFSSPHAFEFLTGEVLPRCSPERVKRSELEFKEEFFCNYDGIFQDLRLSFSFSAGCLSLMNEAEELYRLGYVHLVLVPLPVIQCMREYYNQLNLNHIPLPFRGIRVADRESKKIYSDRFCL